MGILDKVLNSKLAERTKRRMALSSGIYLKIKRLTPSAHEDLQAVMLLKTFNIQTIIDIGANTGQYAESMYDFGYEGKIISFEPGEDAHTLLTLRSKKYPNWIVAERCGLGANKSEATLNVSDNSVFSSMLDIKDSYTKDTPKARVVKSEKITINRLDDIIEKYVNFAEDGKVLLKIDTQGFEKEVLAGGMNTLQRSTGIKMEIPLYQYYAGTGFDFAQSIQFLLENDFHPYAINKEGVDFKTGRTNTIDGTFFREKNS